MNTHKTPVVFRQDTYSGEIIAVFPTLSADKGPDSFVGFTSARGKVAVTSDELRGTKTVSLNGCIGVLQDVVKSGFYPLEIAQRIKGWMHDKRAESLKSAHKKETSNVHSLPRKNPRKTAKKVGRPRKTHNHWLANEKIAA